MNSRLTSDQVKNAPETSGATDPSLYLALASALEVEILNGNIPEFVAINESMIAQLFNVSRTPARQALKTLHDKRLVSPQTKRGYVTGQQTSTPNSRLTDHSACVTAVVGALESSAAQSPLFEDLERTLARISVHGAWRISIRAAQEFYGTSRNMLEEALRDLENIGLVTRRAGGQWIALKMDCQRLEMLFDVRSWLEPKLLEQATVQIPMDVLDKAIADHESALRRLPNLVGSEFDALEGILHNDLMEYAGNAPGLKALRSVKSGIVMSKHVLASDEVPVGTEDPFIEEHLAVLGALKRRRSEEGKVRLLAHLLKSREKCASRLERYKDIARNTRCDFAKLIDE